MNKKKIIMSIVAVLIALPVLFAISIPVVNNITAVNVQIDISKLPLPENTEIVEKYSEAVKFVGNGNGMQYFGAVLLHSELSLYELNAHYSAFRESQFQYIVESQGTQKIVPIEIGNRNFKTDITDENFYIVYSWGNGIDIYEDLDLRGH